MEINIDTLTPKQAFAAMSNILHVRKTTGDMMPFFLHGPPGVGKSDMVAQLAAAANMKLEIEMLTQIEAADMRGLLYIDDDKKVTTNYPPEWLPGPDDEPTIIFLDELPAADRRVQVVGYQLLLTGRIGRFCLHPKHYVCGAGNRVEDGAVVYEMGTALSDRLVHLAVRADVRSWLEWATTHGISPIVMTYLQLHGHMLETLKEQLKADHLIGPSPRSWHRVSNAIKSLGDKRSVLEPLVQGIVGRSAAHDFFLTMEEMKGLPSPKEILEMSEADFLQIIPKNEPNMWGIGYSMIAFADTAERMIKATKFMNLMLKHAPANVAVGDVRRLCMELLLQKAHDTKLFLEILKNEEVSDYLDEADKMTSILDT